MTAANWTLINTELLSDKERVDNKIMKGVMTRPNRGSFHKKISSLS